MFSHGDQREDREAAVLRGDERHRVALVVHELRGRQVPRAAELRTGARSSAAPPSIGSVTDDLLDQRRALAPRDLRAESEQFVPIGDDRRAVDRRQPGDRVDRVVDRVLPLAASVLVVGARAPGRPSPPKGGLTA